MTSTDACPHSECRTDACGSSADASCTRRPEADADASCTRRPEADLDASCTRRPEAEADASCTRRPEADADASCTRRPEADADASCTRRPEAEADASCTRRPEADADASCRRRSLAEMLHLLTAVVVWLVTGSTISSLNKWIFAVYKFRYPLLLSALHMLTAIVADYVLLKLRMIHHRREQDLTPSAKCKVFLLSLTFCASIAFGNLGLTYVQLSFAQMIYSTTPLFTLAISSMVLGQQHHMVKYTAMMPICLGASCSVLGEVHFDQTGCMFVFAATVLRGVKSIQQSILLQQEQISSMFLLYLMAIPSFCILSVAALVLETWSERPLQLDVRLCVCVLLSCLGSVLYNVSSNCVISRTSAVTLHVLGNLSAVGNLLVSQLLFGCELSALSCVGAGLTLFGILLFQNSELIIHYMDRSKENSEENSEDSSKDCERDRDGTKDSSEDSSEDSTKEPSDCSSGHMVQSSLQSGDITETQLHRRKTKPQDKIN